MPRNTEVVQHCVKLAHTSPTQLNHTTHTVHCSSPLCIYGGTQWLEALHNAHIANGTAADFMCSKQCLPNILHLLTGKYPAVPVVEITLKWKLQTTELKTCDRLMAVDQEISLSSANPWEQSESWNVFKSDVIQTFNIDLTNWFGVHNLILGWNCSKENQMYSLQPSRALHRKEEDLFKMKTQFTNIALNF